MSDHALTSFDLSLIVVVPTDINSYVATDIDSAWDKKSSLSI